jgi:hypothetical protein
MSRAKWLSAHQNEYQGMTRAIALARQFLLPLFVFAATASFARGEHATIDLLVIGPDGRQEAFADREPPTGGVNPRPRFTVKSGTPLVLQFILTNNYPHGETPGVIVRYFVVRTKGLGVKETPDLKRDTVTQGTVQLNFKPKDRVGARLKFRVDQPGFYLVRVDTQNTQSDHEHFSAIDLEVK